MNDLDDELINILSKIQNEEIKKDLFKLFLKYNDKVTDLEIQLTTQKRGCISNCNDNDFCNGNDVDANVGKK